MNYIQELNQGKYYHIYNKAVALNLLFKNDDDYILFLSKFKLHVFDYVNVFSYCLLPNHFHFLIQIKDINLNELTLQQQNYINSHGTSKFLSKQFSNFYNSYSKIYNKKYNRKGSLFLRPFKRIEITNENYFTQIIYYIHRNPLHHKYVDNINKWKYSSFQSIVSNSITAVDKTTVLDWFGGIELFKKQHNEMQSDWIEIWENNLE